MRVPAAMFLGLLALSCGSSSSSSSSIPQADACNQMAQAACTKVFSCPASGDIILAGVQGQLGGSVTACEAMVQANYCGTFACVGQTYHGDKAGECKQQFTSATCQSLSTAAVAAFTGGLPVFLSSFPGCGEICTGGTSDAGSGG